VISKDVLNERLEATRGWMADVGADALVVHGAPGVLGSRTGTAGYVRWLAGWTTTTLPVVLVIPLDGRPTVVTMGPHDTRVFAERAGWFGDVVAAGAVDRYPAAVGKVLATTDRVATLGFAEMPAPLYAAMLDVLPARPLIEAGPAIDELRMHRHPEEVAMHRRGAEISDQMIATAMEHAVLPGMTGPRLMADVEHAGRSLGAGTATTWLAIGEKPLTTWMEQVETEGAVGSHDRVQLGTSLTYEGYFAQSLRMGVRGPVGPKLAGYAERLIEIQDAALAAMRPGARLHEVSDAIESFIDRVCPYPRDADPFRFQSCHGLGLSYVEPGMARDLNARRDRTLDPAGVPIRENMVIEIHPNFTTPEVGHVCAGDMALVTSDGAEWLTAFPRGLVEL
jgi:Xaa-Pro dipeptidase